MLDNLARLIQDRDSDGAREVLKQASPQDIARALQDLSPADRQLAFQLLEPESAISTFELLDPTVRSEALQLPPERSGLVPEGIQLLLAERQYETLRRLLTELNSVDVARLLEDLPPEEEMVVFRLLPKDTAVEAFEQMDSEEQRKLLESFTDERARDLVAAMSPDDRTRLLDEVPASVTHRLLQLLPPQQRQATLELLGYAEGSAGRVMTPDFVDLRANMTVAQALERIRRLALDKETVYYSYVTDAQRRLLGAVSLKDLVLARPDAVVGHIMETNPKEVSTHADQEEVARLLSDYDLLAVPVVDSEERLVGIVTHDDVIDIIHEEATEDIYQFGAVPVAERAYFSVNALLRARRRAPWLLFLIGVGFVTGIIIAGQDAVLAEVAVLAAFIPLLIGTGGNIGAQSSTVVVRGLATGEINPGRAVLTLAGEGVVGLLLAAMLGLLAAGLALVLSGGQVQVAIIVGTTLVIIACVAAMVGGGLPFLFRLVGVDPAVASAPLVTTVMDVFGVVSYFLVANALLRL